jgi:hypothetical protein
MLYYVFEQKNKTRQIFQKRIFPIEYFTDEMQKCIVEDLFSRIIENRSFYDFQFVISELDKKIGNYKLQDITKKRFNCHHFVNIHNVIEKLHASNVSCYYCKENVYILYEISREMKQWTLDRIDNNIGHNSDNIVISCLDCNLKRRLINKDSFLFTKQLKLTRIEDP